MKLFAICPICGKKLCKAEEGSLVELQCPECKAQLEIVVTKEAVSAKRNLQTEIQKATIQNALNTTEYGFIGRRVPKQNTTVEPSGKVTFVKSCRKRKKKTGTT